MPVVSADVVSPRVLVVDDHALFREGLRDVLREHGMDVVGEAGSAADAAALSERLRPDVVVMDLSMPGGSGIEATRRIRAAEGAPQVLMLTVSADADDVTAAVLAGACGYLLKDAPGDEIIAAVEAAAAGDSRLSPEVVAGILRQVRADGSAAEGTVAAAQLTDRELEVLRLIAEGKDNPQIASELFISVQTVKNHVSNLLAKLNVDNRIQAAVAAVRDGLL